MPMIDTLARHVAALSEARRLTGMILANNPAFVALQRLETGHDCSSLEAELASDRVYVAYQNLSAELAVLQPAAQSNSTPLSQSIALIPKPAPVEAERRCALTPCRHDKSSVGDKLRYVLGEPAIPAEAAPERIERAAGFEPRPIEASVAIVRRDVNVQQVPATAPGTPAIAKMADGPKVSLLTLFRR